MSLALGAFTIIHTATTKDYTSKNGPIQSYHQLSLIKVTFAHTKIESKDNNIAIFYILCACEFQLIAVWLHNKRTNLLRWLIANDLAGYHVVDTFFKNSSRLHFHIFNFRPSRVSLTRLTTLTYALRMHNFFHPDLLL